MHFSHPIISCMPKVSVTGFSSVGLLSGFAWARSQGYFSPREIHNCNKYVAPAIRQVREVRGIGCGFKGPRLRFWHQRISGNLRAHGDDQRIICSIQPKCGVRRTP